MCFVRFVVAGGRRASGVMVLYGVVSVVVRVVASALLLATALSAAA